MRSVPTAILAAALLFLIQALPAESSKWIDNRNEFGGSTQETVYGSGDKYLDEYFIQRTVAFYDRENNLVRADFFYTPEYGTNRGYTQKSEFYGTNQKPVKGVYFFTPAHTDKKGYFRSTDTYNNKGKVVQSEYEYIEKFANESGYKRSVAVFFQGFIKQWEYDYIESFARKLGYYKRIDYYVYDPYGNGKITGQAFFDKDGKEIKRGKPE